MSCFNKNQTTVIEYPQGNSASFYAIPDTVTSIADDAFSDVFNLTSVTIPGNVTVIGEEAFQDSGLTSITIPGSVTDIEGLAFDQCIRLASINVAGGNPNYTSVGGVLFDKRQATLIQYPEACSASTYAVPAGVTTIEDSAFNGCLNLTNVTLPNGVADIGASAFQFSGLTSITIPASVVNIDEQAFAYCANLTSLYFDGNAPIIDPTTFDASYGYINATIYYYSGTTAWASPFAGLPAVMLSVSGPPALPQVALIFNGGNVLLSWPTNAAGFALQSSTNLALESDWINVSLSPILIGGQNVVIVPAVGRQQFYRLKH